jgi:hypothetical protein
MANHLEQCPQVPLQGTLAMYCIDCEEERVIPMPKNAKYFALSYVWGQQRAPDDDECLSDAPTVVKEAILVTLRLCFRYL